MVDFKSFRNQLYKLNNESFEPLVLEAFHFQSQYNPVYKNYLHFLKVNPGKVNKITDIPFLPISFFKSHEIKTSVWDAETVFESSGTTGSTTSRHLIDDLSFYYEHSYQNFKFFYGEPSNYHILALLPSYLERENSSLVHMVQHLMEKSHSTYNGFYLYNYLDLLQKLHNIGLKLDDTRKILLFGITFALLEAGEQKVPSLSEKTIVIETGGMKGRRREMIREEVHNELCKSLNLSQVHSEYGMTELLSQAYSSGEGKFKTPPWMKVMTRDINDPFSYTNGSGALNVIDLANIHSCCFIETQDIGKIDTEGTFEVMGRVDNSDIRGCNLLWN